MVTALLDNNLTVNGLPAGVTATTDPHVVTLNQPITLIFTTSGTTPVGTSTVTSTGTTTIDGQSVARSASLSLNVLSTENRGQVLQSYIRPRRSRPVIPIN